MPNLTLEHRYAVAFPDDPLPMMYWHQGDGPKLDGLMERTVAHLGGELRRIAPDKRGHSLIASR